MLTPEGYTPSDQRIEIRHVTIPQNLLRPKWSDLFLHGLSGSRAWFRASNPDTAQRLQLDRNRDYLQYLDEFYEIAKHCDIVQVNPGVDLIHPEFIRRNIKAFKVIHAIDDPHRTYSYLTPFAWAYDAVSYISPTYKSGISMDEFLKAAGVTRRLWLPHCVSNYNRLGTSELNERMAGITSRGDGDIVYVGGFYPAKHRVLTRIADGLRKRGKRNFRIYGRYPLWGYAGYIVGDGNATKRVKSLSREEREQLYKKASIGINLHLTGGMHETGNARMYELAFRGVAQVCDGIENPGTHQIFSDKHEILLYSNVEDAIDKICQLIDDPQMRTNIARNALLRANDHYTMDASLDRLLSFSKEHGG